MTWKCKEIFFWAFRYLHFSKPSSFEIKTCKLQSQAKKIRKGRPCFGNTVSSFSLIRTASDSSRLPDGASWLKIRVLLFWDLCSYPKLAKRNRRLHGSQLRWFQAHIPECLHRRLHDPGIWRSHSMLCYFLRENITGYVCPYRKSDLPNRCHRRVRLERIRSSKLIQREQVVQNQESACLQHPGRKHPPEGGMESEAAVKS